MNCALVWVLGSNDQPLIGNLTDSMNCRSPFAWPTSMPVSRLTVNLEIEPAPEDAEGLSTSDVLDTCRAAHLR